ncbi:MAG: hypothetical protein AAF990_00345 [Bacteroidota bacterium]
MNKLFIYLLICFFFFASKIDISAQEKYSLTILVIDQHTKSRISNAKIFIEEAHLDFYTDHNGMAVVSKILPEGKIALLVTKEGYIPYRSYSPRISAITPDNLAIIELVKLPPPNQLIIYGKIENLKNENIRHASVEVGGWIKDSYSNFTDSLGNYQFFIPAPKERSYNELRFKVNHSDYKTYKKNFILQPNQNHIQINTYLKRKFKWDIPFTVGLGTTGGILGVIGISEFTKARKLNDNYERYLNENDFLNIYPQFQNREEAYLKSEDRRKKGRNLINAGISFIAIPILYHFIKKGFRKSHLQNAHPSITPY